MQRNITPRNRFWLILSLILLFSFGIRLWTVGHGLPHIQVTDENSDLSTALRLSEGEIPNNTVRYHRSLIAYINVVSVGALFGYNVLTGQANDLNEFRELYFEDRGAFTIATRITFTMLTTVTIALAALTGRYLSNTIGLLAAALLAGNGFFALNSLYAMPDTLVMFTTSLCIWLSVRLYQKQRPIDYFLAGISLALVMLSKLSAAPVGIGIFVAHGAIVWQYPHHHSWLRRVFNRKILWLIAGVVIGGSDMRLSRTTGRKNGCE